MLGVKPPDAAATDPASFTLSAGQLVSDLRGWPDARRRACVLFLSRGPVSRSCAEVLSALLWVPSLFGGVSLSNQV